MSQRCVVVCLCLSLATAACSGGRDQGSGSGLPTHQEEIRSTTILLPTGAYVTPVAAAGATFQTLNPGLPSRPDFIAGILWQGIKGESVPYPVVRDQRDLSLNRE